MVNLFGNKDGLIGSLELLFMAIFVLGAFVFRKSIANDSFDMGFSVIGSSFLSCFGFIVLKAIGLSLKVSFALSLVAWIIGGFLLAEIIGDGYADGGGG